MQYHYLPQYCNVHITHHFTAEWQVQRDSSIIDGNIATATNIAFSCAAAFIYQSVARKLDCVLSHQPWLVTLREECRLRVFENRVLRRIFGQKRDGVTGGWRKLHNEELHDLYSPPSIIRIIMYRRVRWAGHVA
jgi:hypothetical protein